MAVTTIHWLVLLLTLPVAAASSLQLPLQLAFSSPAWKHSIQKPSTVLRQLKEDNSSFGLYVHIPYCRSRCNYCDFAITPIGGGTNHGNVETAREEGFRKMDARYKNAVLSEIDAIQKSSRHYGKNVIRLRSIYFGGGTPSLAPLSTLQGILNSIVKSEKKEGTATFVLDEDAEITIEMDPGTFDLPYLVAVKEMGFNRISLGVQSFDDNVLATMGRVHRSADVFRSVDMIRQVYGEHANYSIDLISGVPGLTLAGWAETLYTAVRLRPRPMHMSLYDLQLEKGTTFGKWYKDEKRDATALAIYDKSSVRPALPSAEDCAFMYSFASGYLRSKQFEHYEISSYAYRAIDGVSQHRSRHNQIYWEYTGQWYAVGMGATSNINRMRFARPRALSDYILWTENLQQNVLQISPTSQSGDTNMNTPPWLYKEAEGEVEDKHDDLLDVVMTRLRTSEGLDLDWIAGHDNYDETHVIAILRGFELALDLGLGHRIDSRNGRYGCIKLSDPKGFLFSNNIISNIFVALSNNMD